MFSLSETQKTKSRFYQPDIDGLRTIAVLLVLIFHAGFNTLSGGFIGVDIFFVISGYLITGIIVSNIESRSFNYIAFILSRVARLYPALIFILIVCLVFGFVIYTPSDFKELGVTSVYSALSASNFHFMFGSGYFDTSSETNPLLHTWSLAVEQQFYLIWPILIWFSMMFGRKLAIAMIVMLGVVSLATSQYMTSINPTQNYFMVQYRIFEFAAGALLFFLPNAAPRNKFTSSILFIAGMLLIITSAFLFDKTTQFPGVHALIPVAGACLCIIYSKHTPLGVLLRNKLFVSIGLVSYSLYLIHWPIIVFYKYYVFRSLFIYEKVSLIIISLILAYATYEFIENKFRRINLSGINQLSISLASAVSIVILSSAIVFKYDGLSFRINSYFKEKTSDPKLFHMQQYGGNGYHLGTQVIGDKSAKYISAIVVGDSFARQFASAIDTESKGFKFLTSFQDACYFSENYITLFSGNPAPICNIRLKQAIDHSNEYNAPIIFSQKWTGYIDILKNKNGDKIKFDDLNDYISFNLHNLKDILSSIGNRKAVIILSPPGTQGIGSTEKCINRPSYLPMKCTEYLLTDDTNNDTKKINTAIIKEFASDKNVLIVNPYDYLCSNGKCITMTSDYGLVYSDSAHLSKDGASFIWGMAKNKIFEFLK